MKEHRSYFLNFIKLLAESKKIALGEFIARAFELIYNTLCDLNFFVPQASSCITSSFDIFKLHIWELFLCSTTYMLKHEMFTDIHDVLVHTYFLRRNILSDKTQESSYGVFCFHSHNYDLDELLKQSISALKQQITPIGHLLYGKRSSPNIYLFQIYDGLELGIKNSPS